MAIRPQLVDARSAEGQGGPQPVQAAVDYDAVYVQIGGSVNQVRGEIDDAFADMKTFHVRQPDEIMRMAGGHSARLSELRVQIQRIEDFHRIWKAVRVREIEPTLTELERQYQLGSRLHSVLELDWRMQQGER